MSSGLDELLKHYCELSCNPSSLQQRLVIGGRHSEKYEDKMRLHKQDCMMGCAFAAVSDKMESAADQQRVNGFIQTLSKGNENILESSELKQRKQVVEEWFVMMRLQCSKKCEAACEARGDNSYKCARSCAVGCDKFFDAVFAD
eukprot:m.255634 g.255634  ORF g.255634 m.255634 type:complete len:144 (-) comp20019_c0_seq1:197-628(-)